MAEAKLRIKLKHDTEANWLKATTFKPLKGELIIYDVDSAHSAPRFKVGDGVKVVGDLPFADKSFAKLNEDNTFTGNNSFRGTSRFSSQVEIGDFYIQGGTIPSGKTKLRISYELGKTTMPYSDYGSTGITLHHPAASEPCGLTFPWKSGTLALTDDIDVKAAGDNTFTGINIFHKEETATSGDKTISEAKIDPGPTAPLILLETKTVASDGFTITGDATIRPDSIVLSNDVGGYTTSITHDGFTADNSGIYTKYYIGSIVHNTALSGTKQTLNFPDKSGTFALTDYVTANPTADGTTELTKLQVGDTVYTLPNGGGSGDVTAAGDNTFTGSNVFKKAVTLYTDAVNGNSMSATLDSYKLKLLNDLGGVYADLNITDDTAPYLELKTVGYGKVKYTSESIIFTDTQGNSKTTTLKFPGQGATADSIQTLATLKDLDKKQPLLVSGTNVKTINGQSILGSGNLEISGGGTGGSDGIYVHVISFDFTESLNGSTCKGVITITNSSNDNFIVDTNISSNSLTNLTNFLSNINNSFYPLATTNTAGSNLPYIGISYNSDSSEYVVYLSDTSSQTAPVSITIDDTTFVETAIQTSTGGSGGGDSGSGVYTHLVSFGFYRTDDSDIAGWGSIMIPSASAAAIVGTSADNLKTFLAKFNGKFYPMAIKTDGYTTTPYTGIFVNPTNNSLNVVASASSGGNAEFTIDVYDVTETVV